MAITRGNLLAVGAVVLWLFGGAVVYWLTGNCSEVPRLGSDDSIEVVLQCPWTFGQSLYFSVQTGLSIGFGLLSESSPFSKVYSMLHILIGCIFVSGALASFVQVSLVRLTELASFEEKQVARAVSHLVCWNGNTRLSTTATGASSTASTSALGVGSCSGACGGICSGLGCGESTNNSPSSASGVALFRDLLRRQVPDADSVNSNNSLRSTDDLFASSPQELSQIMATYPQLANIIFQRLEPDFLHAKARAEEFMRAESAGRIVMAKVLLDEFSKRLGPADDFGSTHSAFSIADARESSSDSTCCSALKSGAYSVASKVTPRLRVAVVVTMCWIALGTAFSVLFDQNDFVTGMYFSVTTLSTAGMVSAKTTESDAHVLFIAFFALCGVPLFAVCLSMVAQVVLERREDKSLKASLGARLALGNALYLERLSALGALPLAEGAAGADGGGGAAGADVAGGGAGAGGGGGGVGDDAGAVLDDGLGLRVGAGAVPGSDGAAGTGDSGAQDSPGPLPGGGGGGGHGVAGAPRERLSFDEFALLELLRLGKVGKDELRSLQDQFAKLGGEPNKGILITSLSACARARAGSDAASAPAAPAPMATAAAGVGAAA